MDREKWESMSEEERNMDKLNDLSDAVRETAHDLAMTKAMAHVGHGIEPEDFDRAFEREFAKEWDKVKDKTSPELALMGMLELLANGVDISDMFESEEE